MSEKLLHSLMYWFSSGYGTKSPYQYVPANIEDFDKIINTLKPLGYSFSHSTDLIEHVFDSFDSFEYEECKPDIEPTLNVLKVACSQIEEQMLLNSNIYTTNINEKILLLKNEKVFQTYIYQLLEDLSVPYIIENEILVKELDRWYKDGYGISIDRLKLACETDKIFQIITDYYKFTEKSIEVWLMYREAHNSKSLSHTRKIEIAKEFVPFIIKDCIKTSDERKIRSVEVYDYLKKHIYQFLPRKQFEKVIVPNNLYSMVLNCGIKGVLTTKTRCFIGIRLPSSEEYKSTALDDFLSVD
jgi:hypothetical protein